MDNSFQKVKDYLTELEYSIVDENQNDSVLMIQSEEEGIANMMLACDEPILIIEQPIFVVKTESTSLYKRLLQINRELVHGAFVLDEEAKMVIFRDTLQLEHIDLNELQGSINALSLLLSEYSNELIEMSK